MNSRKRIFFLLVLVLLPLMIMSTGCNATKSASDARAENANISPTNENEPDLPASPTIANNATEPLTTYEEEAASLESQQEQTAIEELLCPYTSFSYGRHTIEDSAFIEEVWNAVRFDDWIEIDERERTWESSTTLCFYSGGEDFNISIVPTEEAWVLKPVLDGINYSSRTNSYYTFP